MNLSILGNNSALPAHGRHPTSQLLTLSSGREMLLDCGEGTQMQMTRYGLKWRKLSHIFISHLHGDHYLGLPGLLNSMSLLGRTAPLFLAGPAALGQLLEAISRLSGAKPYGFPLHFETVTPDTILLTEDDDFIVRPFATEHRIECYGYLVEEKSRGRKLLVEKAEAAGVPVSFYNHLKRGESFIAQNGEIIPAVALTEEGPAPKKYAYSADTRYTESFLPIIAGADALYHESTFLQADSTRATERYHSTARQAATLAFKAGVKQLFLGHYSSRYASVDAFEQEASEVFPAVTATHEGQVYEL